MSVEELGVFTVLQQLLPCKIPVDVELASFAPGNEGFPELFKQPEAKRQWRSSAGHRRPPMSREALKSLLVSSS
jgi:hypothetical protein